MHPIELVDCHTHTVFSDGKSTFKENMQVAIQNGITTIACTDHWGRPDFIDCSIEESRLASYVASIDAIREQFPQIEIIHGLEADWYKGCKKDLAETKGTATFLLGSVHYLNEKAIDWDEDMRIWNELGANGLWSLYVEEWCKAATSGLFDSMAHPDLPRLFSTEGCAPTIECAPFWKRMAEAAHEGKVRVEINTAGFLKGFNDFYPSKALLTEFYKAEVPVTVGSDAHNASRIGDRVFEAYQYARSVGYTSIDVPVAPSPSNAFTSKATASFKQCDWRSIPIETL